MLLSAVAEAGASSVTPVTVLAGAPSFAFLNACHAIAVVAVNVILMDVLGLYGLSLYGLVLLLLVLVAPKMDTCVTDQVDGLSTTVVRSNSE